VQFKVRHEFINLDVLVCCSVHCNLADALLFPSISTHVHFDLYFSQEEEVDEMEQWLKSTEVCSRVIEL